MTGLSITFILSSLICAYCGFRMGRISKPAPSALRIRRCARIAAIRRVRKSAQVAERFVPSSN